MTLSCKQGGRFRTTYTTSPLRLATNWPRWSTPKSRQLMVAFAAHAYELEHQQKAGSLTDLVPAYLKTIPQDPLTGTNMVFLP
jgi:hypothetical protein